MSNDEKKMELCKPEPDATRAMPELSPWPDANGHPLQGWARCNAAVVEGAVELAQEILAFTRTHVAKAQTEWDCWLGRHSRDNAAPASTNAAEEACASSRDVSPSHARRP